MVCAVILAVAFVTTISADLGPALRKQAEEQGTRYMERRLHIGSMHVRLLDGSYIFEDLMIEGLKPESIPFFTAKRIVLSMPWSTMFNRRIVFDTIELTDWQMHVEANRDGTQNFPKLTPRGPRGQSSWTTTLQYVHAGRGMFTFQDHNTPWGIVARNLEVTVARPGSEYVGQARFSDGLTAMQGYVPFRTDMNTTFKIDGGRVIFDRMNLRTEGVESVLHGDVNLTYWPELMLDVKSSIDLPKNPLPPVISSVLTSRPMLADVIRRTEDCTKPSTIHDPESASGAQGSHYTDHRSNRPLGGHAP